MNQRLNAPQVHTTSSNLADVGWVAARTHRAAEAVGWGTLRLVDVAGREAMVKGCGVAVARPQGHSWAPPRSNGSGVNVGTIPMVPPRRPARVVGGKTRRRSMPSEWGGGVVVVGAGESPAQGEGPQRVRSRQTERGGRW
ncbi:MAG: hypothetical protein ACRDWA_02930 [Acidimicrobiia bacterium]